mgnify:CR=1 FL=1
MDKLFIFAWSGIVSVAVLIMLVGLGFSGNDLAKDTKNLVVKVFIYAVTVLFIALISLFASSGIYLMNSCSP